MSDSIRQNMERWEDLQVARLLFGLSSEEQVEYEALAITMPAETGHEFEHLIATIDVAWSDSKSLPPHLRDAIRAKAAAELNLLRQSVRPSTGETKSRLRAMTWLPWVIAAACLVVSFVALTSNRNLTPVDLVQQRAHLISTAKDVIELKWSDGPTAIAGAGGDIVWSHQQQQGFMRFRGLPVNEPTVQQYQLWIFDKNQNEKTPVDGGVFDIGPGQDVIVPIHPKLQVREAYLFAVTIEKPGGVVVLSTPNGGYFLNNLPHFSDCPDPAIFESKQFSPDSDGHIFLLYEDMVLTSVPTPTPTLVRPANAKREIRLPRAQDSLDRLVQHLSAIKPIVIIAKSMHAICFG